MTTIDFQGNDGIFRSIDLDGISRVAALEKAVLELQEAVEAIAAALAESGGEEGDSSKYEAVLSDSALAAIAASKEAVAASLEESLAAVEAQSASVLAQTEAIALRLSAVQEGAAEESASEELESSDAVSGTITGTISIAKEAVLEGED